MKKLSLFLILIIGFTTAFGQYYYNTPAITPSGNPGGLNATYEDPYGSGLSPTWSSIQPAAGAAWTSNQTIPFSFLFNGSPVTQYKVNTQGVLTFDVSSTVNPSGPVTGLPNSNIPDKSICMWGTAYSGASSNDKIVVNTFGTAPNRQHWIFFNSYNIINGNSKCWTYWSIVLEETTNKIYIVDQRSSTKNSCTCHFSLGIQINSSSAVAVAGSPNIAALAGTSKTPSDNHYYEFIQGVRPNYDMAVSWIQAGPFVAVNGGPYQIKGMLKNYGAITVTSFDINYQFDNGPIETSTQLGMNMPMYDENWYFHNTPWNPTVNAVLDMKVWATNINGSHADQNNANDTLHKELNVMNVFVPKRKLHEVFTSSTCDDCAPSNANLQSVINADTTGNHAVIKYQMDYPNAGDPYHIAECDVRKTFYGIDSIPDMIVNGTYRMYPGAYTNQQFKDFDEPAFLYSSPTYNRNGLTFNIHVTTTPFQNFPSTSIKAYVAIIESVTHNNAGTNGETSFYNVVKKMIPNANGTSVGPFTVGFNPSLDVAYTFGSNNTIENLNNLKVLVWFQDEVTKEILQAAWASDMSGVEDYGLAESIHIFPNPTTDQFVISFDDPLTEESQITLKDMTGKSIIQPINLVKGSNTQIIHVQDIKQGIYLVEISTESQKIIKKVVIN